MKAELSGRHFDSANEIITAVDHLEVQDTNFYKEAPSPLN